MVGAEPQANTNPDHVSGTGATNSSSIDSHDLAAGGSAADGIRGFKRNRIEEEDDEEEKPRPDRRKIEIKFIQDKSRRHITFSKRKAGIMKKVCCLLCFSRS
jgi:pheromone receptor transcription factor